MKWKRSRSHSQSNLDKRNNGIRQNTQESNLYLNNEEEMSMDTADNEYEDEDEEECL